MNGEEFAFTLSALRRTLRFLPDETGKQHTARIFATAEALQAGTLTWRQVYADENYRRANRLVLERQPRGPYDDDRPGRTVASCDYKPASREERRARDAAYERWRRHQESPVQPVLSVREELKHPKQNKLKRVKERYQR